MSWFTGLFSWLTNLFSKSDNSQLIVKIQAATVKACGFLPMAESVASLIAANPTVLAIEAIANSICSVVKFTKPQTTMIMVDSGILGSPTVPGPDVWIVNGVLVHGEFVK